MPVEPRRRKRRLHVYLREDMVEALEQVAADSELTVSQVVEIVLGFYWELNGVAEKARFMANVHRSFHKTR
jgi:RecA-family ATPase